jgi:hypothetical protein
MTKYFHFRPTNYQEQICEAQDCKLIQSLQRVEPETLMIFCPLCGEELNWIRMWNRGIDICPSCNIMAAWG